MDMGKHVGLAMCLARLPVSHPRSKTTEAVVVSTYATLADKPRGDAEGEEPEVEGPECWLHAVEIVSPCGRSDSSNNG